MIVFRRLLPWFFAVAFIANCWELATLTVLHWNGNTGMVLLTTGKTFEREVKAVSGPALRAGLRAGDRVDVRALHRANGFANPVPGVPYRVIAHRRSSTIVTAIVPVQVPLDFSQVVRLAAVFWLIGFALLIAMRGTPSRENALLVTILLALATTSALDRMVWSDNRLAFVAAGIISPISWNAACVALLLYAGCFGRPRRSVLRTLLSSILYAAVAFDLVRSVISASAAMLYPWTDPDSGIVNGLAWGGVFNWDPLFLALGCVVAAIPAARPDERRRLGWVVASFTPYLIGVAVGSFSGAASAWSAGPVVSTTFALQNASFFFIPAGLTYAALAKRMFDVGFVINRAAVFAGVSIVVVGAFVLVEWALGKWFEDVSHATSLAVNAGLALTLGLSIRFVHKRIDGAVDRVFFRKRHENETALRRFSHEAAFFTDAHKLIERARTTILSHSEALIADIVMADGIDPNDAAAIAMRAWREPLDLHNYDTSLRGEMAFPMVAHGTFVGALLCGPKRTGERYAPDEIAAIQDLAHGVGLAIDNLQRDGREATSFSAISAMFAAISARLDQLTQPPETTPR